MQHGTGPAERDFAHIRERRLANRLTAVKLAGQILERKTELTTYQRQLVGTLLQAADELADELLPKPGQLPAPEQPRPGCARTVRSRRGAVARVTMLGSVWRQAAAVGKQGLSRLAHEVLAPPLSGLRARLAPRPSVSHVPKRA